MGRMLLEFQDEGIDHSALWPFERSFYRRLGWETGSRYLRVEAPPEELRTAGADRTGIFESTEADEWERLVPVHGARDAGRGLHVDRTEARWRRRIFEGWGDDPYVYRWDDGAGETRAYVTYVIEDGDGDDGLELRVYEASWTDHHARRQLLRFLGDHDSQVGTVKFTAALDPDFPILEAVEDPSSVTVEVEVGHMVRLTDVAAGLSSSPTPRGRATSSGSRWRTRSSTRTTGRSRCRSRTAAPSAHRSTRGMRTSRSASVGSRSWRSATATPRPWARRVSSTPPRGPSTASTRSSPPGRSGSERGSEREPRRRSEVPSADVASAADDIRRRSRRRPTRADARVPGRPPAGEPTPMEGPSTATESAFRRAHYGE